MENHITTTNMVTPPGQHPDGTRVVQYGPEWVRHVTSGGNVVHGNLLVQR